MISQFQFYKINILGVNHPFSEYRSLTSLVSIPSLIKKHIFKIPPFISHHHFSTLTSPLPMRKGFSYFLSLFQVVLELENVGKDDFSYSQHMSHLLSETLKSRPNTEMMKDLMRRTIFKRMPEMKGTTSEVMEKFPFLKRPNLVSVFFLSGVGEGQPSTI